MSLTASDVRYIRDLGQSAYHQGMPRMAVTNPMLESYINDHGLGSRMNRTECYKQFRAGWLQAEKGATQVRAAPEESDGRVITPDGVVIETTGRIIE